MLGPIFIKRETMHSIYRFAEIASPPKIGFGNLQIRKLQIAKEIGFANP